MASDGFRISTQAVRETSAKIKHINDSLDSKLVEINKCMNDLEATYKSDASTEIREAMNSLKPRFEEYKSIVASYAKHLEDTAQSFESSEAANVANASAFKKNR